MNNGTGCDFLLSPIAHQRGIGRNKSYPATLRVGASRSRTHRVWSGAVSNPVWGNKIISI
eukprot:826322-Pyramimonas_sp.AAC.1